jgi:hypothetical protein
MTPVSYEFRFGEAQFADPLRRGMIPDASLVYAASPASGLLSLSPFQNLEIAFAPLVEKWNSLQFLFTGRQNTKTTFIRLCGSDVQLRIRFDPPELTYSPLTPLSEPTIALVQMTNPTDYPVEVLST